MKFGVFDHMDDAGVPLQQFYQDRLRIIEAYDRIGIHAYHVAEHHATPLGVATSPSVFLSAVAQRTTRLRFGPLVYLLPFYHPLRLIEEIGMLDQMSGGRLELGVGRGVSPLETASYDLDYNATGAMYHEAFAVLMQGLTSETLDFAGEFYTFKNVPMLVRPLQQPHPPLWYGLGVPDNAPWPAQNDVNVVMLGQRPSVKAVVDRYLAERDKAGKPRGTVPLMGLVRHVVVAETDAEAQRIARRAYPRWAESFHWLWKRHGASPRIGALYPPDWDALVALGNGVAGSPDTVRDFIAADVAETGINYFLSWLAFGELTLEESLRSTELYGREVMPALAGL